MITEGAGEISVITLGRLLGVKIKTTEVKIIFRTIDKGIRVKVIRTRTQIPTPILTLIQVKGGAGEVGVIINEDVMMINIMMISKRHK